MLENNEAQTAYNSGINFLNSGQPDLALAEFAKVPEQSPVYAAALNLSGRILLDKTEIAKAAALFTKAIALEPANPEFYFNLAISCQLSGNLAEAVENYHRAIGLRPQANYYISLAKVLETMQDYQQACNCYNQVIRLIPENPYIYNAYGLALKEAGNYPLAAESLKQAINLKADEAIFFANLGNLYKSWDKTAEAIKYLEKAVQLQPHNPFMHSNLAAGYLSREDYHAAGEEYRAALSPAPGNKDLIYNLAAYYGAYGTHLFENGDYPAAEANFREAVRLKPDEAIFYSNLGNLFKAWNNLDLALDFFQQALALEPLNPLINSDLAVAYKEKGDFQAARQQYGAALDLDPANSDIIYNLSLLNLLFADFKNGWHLEGTFGYLKKRREKIKQLLKKPEWQGEDLSGKKIYVYSEQGLGDTIQFFRYLALLKQKGAFIIFSCQPGIKSLFQDSPLYDILLDLPLGETGLDYDYQVSLLALPALFKIDPDTMPSLVPYINASKLLCHKWQQILSAYPGYKAGIAWETLYNSGARYKRRFPLEHFCELARLPGLTLFNLQKGPAADGLSAKQADSKIVNLAEDFANTAAIINNLDLVISVDTSIAHLAGAMARPVWTLLSFSPDWRWFLNRADSPWYPTMRLFRQDSLHNWSNVLAELKEELSKKIAGLP